MAITTEIIGRFGGGGVDIVDVGEITNDDLVIYSFTLDKPSVVSACLDALQGTTPTVRWGALSPTIQIRPQSGDGEWGVTRFQTAVLAGGSGSTTEEEQTQNAAWLSISAPLPPGDYKIVINSRGSTRRYTVDTATITTTPL